MRRKVLISAVLVSVPLAFGGYVLKERNLKYRPYKAALYRGLSKNDFAWAFASPPELKRLRDEYGFLEGASTERERVLSLIDHLDRTMKGDESWSVRAMELHRTRKAACEVHALAVAVLAAYGIHARWISGVKGSIGFGYLEAFVEGRWELFVLRDKSRRALGVSALELYRTTEPSINIRAFYSSPGHRVRSWMGSVHVAVLPLANLVEHPELEVLFKSDQGVESLEYGSMDPYDYVFDWSRRADDAWIKEERVMAQLQARYRSFRYRRRRALGRLIDGIDRVVGTSSPPPL